MHVACGEYLRNVGRVRRFGRRNIAPRAHAYGKCFGHVALAAYKTRRDQQKFAGDRLLAAFHDLKLPVHKTHLRDHEFLQVSLFVADRFLHRRLVATRILAEAVNGFLVAVVGLLDLRPFGPGVIRRALLRRLRHHLQRRHRLTAVTDHRTDAVIARVTAADNDDVLTLRGNVSAGCLQLAHLAAGDIVIQDRLRGRSQEIYRIIHTAHGLRVDACKGPRLLCAAAQNDRVILFQQFLRGDIHADVHAGLEGHAFGLHQRLAAQDHGFIQFHIRDAVHQQTADTVAALVHSHAVAAVVQRIRRRQTRGAASDDSDLLAAANLRRHRLDEAFFERRLDDEQLVVVNGDRGTAHAVDAGLLAQRRAHSSGELREVGCLRQTVECVRIIAQVDFFVPLGDQVMQRATGHHAIQFHGRLAEGHAAVHAARALRPPFLRRQRLVKFTEVRDPGRYRHIRIFLSFIFQKSGRLSHDQPSFEISSNASRTAASRLMPFASYFAMVFSMRL